MLHFTKMHGCGNDYIYFNCFKEEISDPAALSIRLSDRHCGVGGDGIILICPSDQADAKMRIFNADGSEGKMCGNGIRCVGKYLYDHGIAKKETLQVETLSGIKTLKLTVSDKKVSEVTVDMGKADLSPKSIPVLLEGEKIVDSPIVVEGQEYRVTCVSMGNPHCVIFTGDVAGFPLEKIGPFFEKNPLFPEQVNTEFVRIIDSDTLEMRVWERGSGETMACGTGACATAVAAVENGFAKKGSWITVRLRGGDLSICYEDSGRVLMKGPAAEVFRGEIEE